jgi:hypothetical protein
MHRDLFALFLEFEALIALSSSIIRLLSLAYDLYDISVFIKVNKSNQAGSRTNTNIMFDGVVPVPEAGTDATAILSPKDIAIESVVFASVPLVVVETPIPDADPFT